MSERQSELNHAAYRQYGLSERPADKVEAGRLLQPPSFFQYRKELNP
jgi:hypothetical protein